MLDVLVSLANGLGLLALVAVIYGAVERLRVTRETRSVLHGLAFGLAAVIAMTSPAVLVPGILVDSRATLVAFAGAFAGPVAAALATVIGSLYRLWLGGAGVVPGVVTLLLAFAVGLVWRYSWFKRRNVTATGLVLLALGISLQCVLIAFLPIELTTSFVLLLVGTITASALFATLVLGGMIHRENRMIAREKSLIDDAFTDALTGLPNRRALFGAEAAIRARSSRRGFVVLLVDVDHFKLVNDRHGHDVGDTTLCILSEQLRIETREGDIVARLGGEEFVVVLPGTDAEEGLAVAERLRAAVGARRIVTPTADLAVTVSIGLAFARQAPLNEAIQRADEALYRAKSEGRDRVVAAPAVASGRRVIRATRSPASQTA